MDRKAAELILKSRTDASENKINDLLDRAERNIGHYERADAIDGVLHAKAVRAKGTIDFDVWVT